MGDLKKKLNEQMENEAVKRESRKKSSTDTVRKLTGSNSKTKDKVISAKVYPETWTEFTQINKAQGMTNNSVINMLISRYVRDNRNILDDI